MASSHGSHWLRLQPRGATKYKTHNKSGSSQAGTLGWRWGLLMGHTGYHAGGHGFTMSSFVEDHMSREDLGVDATNQEWSALKKLGPALMRWDNRPIDPWGNWLPVPPRVPEVKEPRPRSRGRKKRWTGVLGLQSGTLGLPTVDPLSPGTPSAGSCLSGCTLLAGPSGGIPMREIRVGTNLLNAKGKRVKVTQVYFSRESL